MCGTVPPLPFSFSTGFGLFLLEVPFFSSSTPETSVILQTHYVEHPFGPCPDSPESCHSSLSELSSFLFLLFMVRPPFVFCRSSLSSTVFFFVQKKLDYTSIFPPKIWAEPPRLGFRSGSTSFLCCGKEPFFSFFFNTVGSQLFSQSLFF